MIDIDNISSQPIHVKTFLMYVYSFETYVFESKLENLYGRNNIVKAKSDWEEKIEDSYIDTLEVLNLLLHIDYDYKSGMLDRVKKEINLSPDLNSVFGESAVFRNESAALFVNLFGVQVWVDLINLTFYTELLNKILIGLDIKSKLYDPSQDQVLGIPFLHTVIGLIKLINEEKSTTNFDRLIKQLSETQDDQIFSSKLIGEMYSYAYEKLAKIVPALSLYEERIGDYTKLKEKLGKIESGIKTWVEYEAAVYEILNFNFIPQFTKVHVQAKSTDGHERRDFIISNNTYLGVWNSLFHQYNCNNIVVEAKNKRRGEKSDVNQLRIYLSKPTIGKFGILTVRNLESKSLRSAIRLAYEQQGIFILALSDRDLLDMTMCKIVNGNIDAYIEYKKIEFEINY